MRKVLILVLALMSVSVFADDISDAQYSIRKTSEVNEEATLLFNEFIEKHELEEQVEFIMSFDQYDYPEHPEVLEDVDLEKLYQDALVLRQELYDLIPKVAEYGGPIYRVKRKYKVLPDDLRELNARFMMLHRIVPDMQSAVTNLIFALKKMDR